MSLLISVEDAEFNFLLEKTAASKGNLSVQISKLKGAKYISVHKSFRGNYPLTKCKITTKGITAFESYVAAMKGYLGE